jgi:hypothetical protein
MFSEDYTTAEWVGLVLDNDVESFDALIDILALVVRDGKT